MYCLDTNFLLNFLEPSKADHRDAVKFYQANKSEPMAIPLVAHWEVIRGELAISGKSKMRQVDEELRTCFLVFPMSESVLYEACDIFDELHQIGQPINSMDLLIAATARLHDWIVVSTDKHYTHVPRLATLKFA